MKKLLKRLTLCLACLVLALGFISFPVNRASAETSTRVVVNDEIAQEMLSIVEDYSKLKVRIAGSDGEKEASEFILQYLMSDGTLVPTNMGNSLGVQTFRFTSIFDGKQYDSQNISYSYVSGTKTDKKVIIGCSYDSIAFNDKLEAVENEGINGSAGSVAVLLALSKYIPKFAPEFNIDFVFFGAGESNNAGSVYYTNGISKEDSENILLMLNIDKVAVGKNLYFYSDEKSNAFSKFASSVSKQNELAVNNVDTVHLNKILLETPNEIGLNYTHIAQSSNNINFMKLGILSLNLFAGEYDDGVVIGRSEYAGKNAITYTENDTLEYINKNLGDKTVSNNLSQTFGFVQRVLTDTGFVKACETAAHENDSFYSIFTNQKLVIYLTVLAFVISVIVAMLIYYKLTVRAYHADIDSQFAISVLSITENLGESITSAEVPKAVSQMIATDIKKDKRIKQKKKKNDDK